VDFHPLQALIELQKAQRMSKLEPGWDRQLDKLKRVVSFTMDYCQSKYLLEINSSPPPPPFSFLADSYSQFDYSFFSLQEDMQLEGCVEKEGLFC
jgi:hypothetical protein